MAYNDYLKSIIGDIKHAPSNFYRFIRSKRTDSNSIPGLIHNGLTVESDKEKTGLLNGFFSSTFTRENMSFVPFRKSNVTSMPNIHVTLPGIIKLLKNLNPTKAKGPDGMSPRFLKECAEEIAPMLCLIFNRSLELGQVPSDWKDANVTPLYKKGRKDSVENYRPVSLTCIVSKVIEHVVYSSISRHLEQNSILTPRQHGFRPNHSCESQLILAIDDWASALDRREQVDIAILDFSKAFDTVPHERLKSKLHCYGIRGITLSWVASFLANRRQESCGKWVK
ncbi:MAG: reverse transcriptase family protein [Oscillospiraceae bacterium]